MKLFELLNSVEYSYRILNENETDLEIDITAVVSNSRQARQGCLYVAIEGLHKDGHLFIEAAIASGAAAIAVSEAAIKEQRVEISKIKTAVIAFEDTRKGLSHLSSAFYSHPHKRMTMVGITGTNGKTSTSRLLYEMLSRSGISCGVIGTTGCFSPKGRIVLESQDPDANMTTPDPEQLYKALSYMEKDGAKAVIMEVTSHALALSKVAPIIYDIGIFTNLTEDHLDFHRDMESYFEEKKKLFDSCREAIINTDDIYGRRLASSLEIPTHNASSEGRGGEYSAEDIHLYGTKGLEYKISSRNLRMRVRTSLSGRFNIMNTMQAAIAARLLGVQVRDIQATLATFSGVEGRLQRIKLKNSDYSVYIDYAHTPDALEKLIRTARAFCRRGERLVVLFGCGGDRDKQKRPIMGKIASEGADLTVITADNSRSENTSDIIKDILSGVSGESCCTVIENRKKAIEYVIENARVGDVILLCGKGHEQYEIDRSGRKPFCEEDIVRAAANEL